MDTLRQDITRDHRRFTREEEAELARQGTHEAKEKLFLSIAPMAIEQANHALHRYAKYNRAIRHDDLVAASLLGAWEGVLKFDPDKGCRLTTYVRHWMWRQIMARLREDGHIIHIPWTYRKEILAEGLPSTKPVASIQCCDSDLENQNEKGLIDEATIPDGRSERELDEKTVPQILETYAEVLTPREMDIMKTYYSGKTLDQVGKERGITRERIRQIIARGIKKIRIGRIQTKDRTITPEDQKFLPEDQKFLLMKVKQKFQQT